jgi:hypothetical protein
MAAGRPLPHESDANPLPKARRRKHARGTFAAALAEMAIARAARAVHQGRLLRGLRKRQRKAVQDSRRGLGERVRRSTNEVACRRGCVSCRSARCRSETSCLPRRSRWRHARTRRAPWPAGSLRTVSISDKADLSADAATRAVQPKIREQRNHGVMLAHCAGFDIRSRGAKAAIA